ncbi:MAG: class I SAM-dependent methyltransferase [Nanoarchaeota archaeon]|nr:class I SAM-dependent methyltransferase [Nanoarchaeota archaeon]
MDLLSLLGINHIPKGYHRPVTTESYRIEEEQPRFPVLSDRVIDVGCSNGALTNWIRSKYPMITYLQGIDIDNKLVESAKAQYPNVFFTCGDGYYNLLGQINGIPADYILMMNHIGWKARELAYHYGEEGLEDFVASPHQALKEGGHLIITRAEARLVCKKTGNRFDVVEFIPYFAEESFPDMTLLRRTIENAKF